MWIGKTPSLLKKIPTNPVFYSVPELVQCPCLDRFPASSGLVKLTCLAKICSAIKDPFFCLRKVWFCRLTPTNHKNVDWTLKTDHKCYFPGNVDRGGETFPKANRCALQQFLLKSVANISFYNQILSALLILQQLKWKWCAIKDQNRPYLTVSKRLINYVKKK